VGQRAWRSSRDLLFVSPVGVASLLQARKRVESALAEDVGTPSHCAASLRFWKMRTLQSIGKAESWRSQPEHHGGTFGLWPEEYE